MTSFDAVRARRRRWACCYGTLAIVAAYVGVVAHLGHPSIPGYIGLALVGVLTWVSVAEVQSAAGDAVTAQQ